VRADRKPVARESTADDGIGRFDRITTWWEGYQHVRAMP
jgi:hypothetical protein